MKTTIAFAAALAIAAGSAAHAELSQKYRDWGAGPYSFLFTDAERAEWAKLQDDKTADEFIGVFWAKRDPTPETRDNEYRAEFEGRVLAADKQLGAKDVRGSMTDRGHVFLLFGQPTRIVRQAKPAAVEPASGPGAGELDDLPGAAGGGLRENPTDRDPSQHETWVYEKEQLPKSATKKKYEIRFLAKPGSDLLAFEKPADWTAPLAAEAAAVIKRPNLTLADLIAEQQAAAPAAPAAPAKEPFRTWKAKPLEDAARLDALHAALAAKPALDAALDTGAFQDNDGDWILPIQVSVPTEKAFAGDPTLVGEVLDAGGASVFRFEATHPWTDAGNRTRVLETVVVPPGQYTLQVGLVDPQGQVVWAAKSAQTAPAEAKFWISDLVLSEDIHPMPSAQEMLEPWAWQGIAVVPKGDLTFPHGSALWYYLHTCYASLGPDGKPTLKEIVELGGPRKFRGPQRMEPAKSGDNCWILAQAIDITPEFTPGDYEMKISVTDTTTNTTLTTPARKFRIVAAPGAAPPAK